MRPTKWHLVMGFFGLVCGISALSVEAHLLGGALLWLSGANFVHWQRDIISDKSTKKEES